MTLYWSTLRYQCNVNPVDDNTYYSCNTSNTNITYECDMSLSSNPVIYGLQIDDESYEPVDIDRIIIYDIQNDRIIDIDYFCFNGNSAQTRTKDSDHCLQAINGGYDLLAIAYDTHQHILFEFDITDKISNESYAQTTDQSPQCIPDGYSCIDAQDTSYYGGSGGSRSVINNQGRIHGISSWGIGWNQGIGNFSWQSDNQTVFETVGIDPLTDFSACNPFELDMDDYIDGYRVIYGNGSIWGDVVHGLFFYTKNGKTYQCVGNVNSPYYTDSGNKSVDGFYLSGFNLYYGTVIDSISFQFTSLSNSNLGEKCDNFDQYIFVSSSKSWHVAQNYCVEHFNSNLATITTDEDLQIAVAIRENNYVHFDKIWPNNEIWIGLSYYWKEKIFGWADGTSCTYAPNASCNYDTRWNIGQPDDYDGVENCVSMRSTSVNGLYNDLPCSYTFQFLCNNGVYVQDPTKYPTKNPTRNPTKNPTKNPTRNPTKNPTRNPTRNPTKRPTRAPFSTNNIIITTHNDINEHWFAFNISNTDLSCGGSINLVKVSGSSSNENQWINYSVNVNNYYEFNNLSYPLTIPISIQVTKRDINNDEVTLEGKRIIYLMEGGIDFNFEDNFCIDLDLKSEAIDKYYSIKYTYYYVAVLICFVFVIIGIISLLHAHCRKNDHFRVSALFASLLQMLDMVSDIFFVVDVWSQYKYILNEQTNNNQFQYLFIFILSIIFILIPVIISLFQLHGASSKYWLFDNRIREWLLTYVKLLYLTSVFTGSSFTAIEIFNSDLFGLDLFYMGLSKQHFESFTKKKVYSIVLLENCPQLILSIWYTLILGKLSLIPVASAIFSLISITVTIVSIILRKRIYNTQDYVYITVDITGQSVMNNIKICKNRMENIKLHLCQSVLGVNTKSTEIMKPFIGSAQNGLQLEIHISYIHNKSNVDPADSYEDKLNAAIDHGTLQKVIEQEWELSSLPKIANISCEFVKSKEKKRLSIATSTNDEEMRLEDTDINHPHIMKQSSVDSIREIELDPLNST